MHSKIKFLFSVILIAISFCAIAQEGGPPMLTDDARVADYKEWELNPSINTVITDHLLLSAPHIDLNYGILPNLQLKIEAPLLFDFSKKPSADAQIGEINFGVKYRFLDEEKHFVSAATFPQYCITGDKGLFIPVFLEKTFGKFLGGIATAYFLGENNDNRYEMGALTGYRATEKFHVMLEYYNVNALYIPEGDNGYVNFGFRAEFTENLFLMGSLGTQVNTPAVAKREKLISWFGMRMLF